MNQRGFAVFSTRLLHSQFRSIHDYEFMRIIVFVYASLALLILPYSVGCYLRECLVTRKVP